MTRHDATTRAMSEEMRELGERMRAVAFRGIEVGQSSSGDADMQLVLKTTDEGDEHEYLVPVPAEQDGEYTLLIRSHLSRVTEADSFIGEVQGAVGCHMSSLAIRRDEERETDVARMTITTDEMEQIPFGVVIHEGVLYAMIHSLPILVEERLLVPSVRRDEVMEEGLLRRRSPEAEYSALRYGLEAGRMPEDYEEARLRASLDVIGEERVRALQQQAIETERYEWAQWIADYYESHDERSE